MPFTQDQSVRLGQRVPSNNTAATVLTGVTLPEVAYEGQIVFRKDTFTLEVFDGAVWRDIETSATVTFVQGQTTTGIPTSLHVGDLWFDSDNSMNGYTALSAGAHTIGVGAWVLTQNNAGTTSAITLLQAQVPRIGSMMLWGPSGLPTGNWVKADGSAVNRAGTYASLFSAIGTTYGVGDGSTTFNLPNPTPVSSIGWIIRY